MRAAAFEVHDSNIINSGGGGRGKFPCLMGMDEKTDGQTDEGTRDDRTDGRTDGRLAGVKSLPD